MVDYNLILIDQKAYHQLYARNMPIKKFYLIILHVTPTQGNVNVGAESLSQVITERNQLRSQNDQLWKLIEKQKSVIDNLQKENQKLANERERLIIKLRDNDSINTSRSEDDKASIEKGVNENKKPVESDNSSNSNNDIIVTAAPSTDKSLTQSVRQLPTVSVNSSQSKQSSSRQLSLLDKATSLETKSLHQQDSSISTSSDISINSETSVSAYGESNIKVADEAKSSDQQNKEIHQLQKDTTNSVKNENGIITHFNESFPSITVDSNDTSSNLVKIPCPLPPVLPPKSIQRQNSLQIDDSPKASLNLTEVQDYQDSPRNSQEQPAPLPLYNIDQNSESSVLQNLPSPTISIKSSGSESVGSSGDTSRYTHNSTAQTVDTDLENLDENDALDQFPQPTPREQAKFQENHNVNRLDSEENISSLTENEHKVSESLGLSSSLTENDHKVPESLGLSSSLTENDHKVPESLVLSSSLTENDHKVPESLGLSSSLTENVHKVPEPLGLPSSLTENEHKVPEPLGLSSSLTENEHKVPEPL
ncbi:10061_t:CDS:2, partial [Funneliformis geosporum]